MTPEEVFLKLVHGVADRDFDALPGCTPNRPTYATR